MNINEAKQQNLKSWHRVSESIGDIAECFHGVIPESRINYTATNLLNQIVRYLDVFIASLDLIDHNHENAIKEKRTAFNYKHIYPDRPKKNYNGIQNEFLDFFYERTKIEVFFRTDEAASFAKTSETKNSAVIGALKSCKQIQYTRIGNARHSIKISPFEDAKINNNNLNKTEKDNLIYWLNSSKDPLLKFLKFLKELRNEEIHSSPVSARIDYNEHILISTNEKFSRIVHVESGGTWVVKDSVLFLCPVLNNDIEIYLERYPNIKETLLIGINIDTHLHGYKNLAMPDNRIVVAKKAKFSMRNVAIAGTADSGILLSKDAYISFENVKIIFPEWKELLVSGNSISEICDQVPWHKLSLPSIKFIKNSEEQDLSHMVNHAILMKTIVDDFLASKDQT